MNSLSLNRNPFDYMLVKQITYLPEQLNKGLYVIAGRLEFKPVSIKNSKQIFVRHLGYISIRKCQASMQIDPKHMLKKHGKCNDTIDPIWQVGFFIFRYTIGS